MIRYYKKEDIEQIAKIIDEDWKIVYRGIIDEEYLEKLNYKDREKRIRSKYEKEKAIVYIEDNVVKGFCRFGESRDEGEGLGEIYALYVKLDNIKKGIGKTLVERAMKIFREKGYKEITLLGQNVDSYGKDLNNGDTFAKLLDEVASLNIPRLRFLTSYPSDFKDDVIDVMAKHDNIMKFIHLPVQSGSDEILRLMNRRYNSKEYLELSIRRYKEIKE